MAIDYNKVSEADFNEKMKSPEFAKSMYSVMQEAQKNGIVGKLKPYDEFVAEFGTSTTPTPTTDVVAEEETPQKGVPARAFPSPEQLRQPVTNQPLPSVGMPPTNQPQPTAEETQIAQFDQQTGKVQGGMPQGRPQMTIPGMQQPEVPVPPPGIFNPQQAKPTVPEQAKQPQGQQFQWSGMIAGGEPQVSPVSSTSQMRISAEEKPKEMALAQIHRNAMNQGELATLVPLYSTPTPESIQRIAQINAEMENAPLSEAMRNLQEKGSFANMLQATPEVIYQSLASMIRSGYGTILGSTAAGATVGSTVPFLGTLAGAGYGFGSGMVAAGSQVEYASSLMEGLREQGVNVSDPNQLSLAFSNPNIINNARKFAAKRTAAIMVFDAATMGVAGKFGVGRASSTLGNVARLGGELGVQATGGSAGEAFAQFVSGQEINPQDIIMEGLGELGTAPGDIFSAKLRAKKNPQQVQSDANRMAANAPMNPEEVDAFVNTSVEAEFIAPENAEQAKSTLNKANEINAKIPAEIKDTELRVTAIGLIEERENLTAQLETVDEAFKPAIQEKIKGINEQLQELTQIPQQQGTQAFFETNQPSQTNPLLRLPESVDAVMDKIDQGILVSAESLFDVYNNVQTAIRETLANRAITPEERVATINILSGMLSDIDRANTEGQRFVEQVEEVSVQDRVPAVREGVKPLPQGQAPRGTATPSISQAKAIREENRRKQAGTTTLPSSGQTIVTPAPATGTTTTTEVATDEDKTGLILYHGSPSSFENFDISKIGTGEGAQAFGYGLYFTNEVDIAKGYANRLGSKKNFWESLENGNELSLSKEDFDFIKNEVDSLGFDGYSAEQSNIGNIRVGGNNEYAPDVLEALAIAFGKNAVSELESFGLTKEQIDRFLEIKRKISDPQLYKISAHEGKSPSDYEYIDWREKLTDSQRKKIGRDLDDNITGEEIYKLLSQELGGDQKASEFLLSKGIDGITYKSQKGTGGKTGTGRNYVIFDPNVIRIDEINQQKQLPKSQTTTEPVTSATEPVTTTTEPVTTGTEVQTETQTTPQTETTETGGQVNPEIQSERDKEIQSYQKNIDKAKSELSDIDNSIGFKDGDVIGEVRTERPKGESEPQEKTIVRDGKTYEYAGKSGTKKSYIFHRKATSEDVETAKATKKAELENLIPKWEAKVESISKGENDAIYENNIEAKKKQNEEDRRNNIASDFEPTQSNIDSIRDSILDVVGGETIDSRGTKTRYVVSGDKKIRISDHSSRSQQDSDFVGNKDSRPVEYEAETDNVILSKNKAGDAIIEINGDIYKLYQENIDSPEKLNKFIADKLGLTPKEDAVQKQTAGQVPVQSGTTSSQEVAKGEPQAEPQSTAKQGQAEATSEAEVKTTPTAEATATTTPEVTLNTPNETTVKDITKIENATEKGKELALSKPVNKWVKRAFDTYEDISSRAKKAGIYDGTTLKIGGKEYTVDNPAKFKAFLAQSQNNFDAINEAVKDIPSEQKTSTDPSPKTIEENSKEVFNDAQSAFVFPIGLNPKFKFDSRLPENVVRFFKKYFRPRGLWTKGMFSAKRGMENQISAQQKRAEYAVRDLSNAVKKAYPKGITKDQVSAINDVLQGMPRELPPNLYAPIEKMREHIDELSQLMISEGIVDQKLVPVFNANMGIYTTRTYAIHNDPEKWIRYINETPEGQQIRNNAVNFLRQETEAKADRLDKFADENEKRAEKLFRRAELAEGDKALMLQAKADEVVARADRQRELARTMRERDFDAEVKAFLFAKGQPLDVIRKGNVGAKDLGILKKRKNIPDAIRSLMGEEKDALTNYTMSVAKMSALIANNQFLNEVKAQGVADGLFTKTPKGKNIAEIASASTDSMSPLNGLYTTKDIAEAFKEFDANTNNPWYVDAMLWANGIVKINKTVLSEQSVVRNFISNPIIELANGYIPTLKGKAINTQMEEILNVRFGDKSDVRGYIEKLTKLGVLGQGGNYRDIQAVFEDLKANNYDYQKLIEPTIKRAAKSTWNVAQKIYKGGDEFWKVVAFENERAILKKAYGDTKTDEELDQMTADKIRKTRVDYSMAPKVVKAINRLPVAGTFVTFPAEIIRIGANIPAVAYEEMNSGNKVLREQGIKRMAGYMTAMTLSYGLSELTRYLVGMDDEEEEARKQFLAPWAQNSTLVWIDKNTYVDTGFSDAFSILKKPVVAFLRGADFVDGSIQAVKEFLGPVISEEIGYKTYESVKNNRDEYDNPIYDENAEYGTKVNQIASYILKKVEPGTISQARRLYLGETGALSEKGQKYSTADEVTNATFGIKRVTVNWPNAVSFKFRSGVEQINNSNKFFLKETKELRKNDVEGRRKAAESTNLAVENTYNDLRKYYTSALKIGMIAQNVGKIMKEAGVSDELLKAVVNNTGYKNYIIILKDGTVLDRQTQRQSKINR